MEILMIGCAFWRACAEENVTFPLESYWQSFVDPCVATLLALIAFAPLISIGFGYGFHPPLRMTQRGGAVRTCENGNAACDGYTSSVTCRIATCDSFSSRRSLQMRCFRLPNSHFSFTEESILKFVSLKVRNLVSLPLEGKALYDCHICGVRATTASGGLFDEPIGSACGMPQGGLCKPPA